jgi:CrcB protein
MKTLWIAVGGALGTIARYHLGALVQRGTSGSFPYGTLAINLLGSFLISLVMGCVSLRNDLWPPTLTLALTTGVLGGFTTYSTFNYETLSFFHEGAVGIGLAYIASTLLGALAAGMLGFGLAKLLLG